MHWWQRFVCESSGMSRHLIKLSFWVWIWVGLPAWTLTCVESNYMTRLSSQPHSYLSNLLGCTNSTSIITSLLSVYPQYSQYNPLSVCQGINTMHFPSRPANSLLCVFFKSTLLTHTFVLPSASLSLPLCFCDLRILSASLGCCRLFSVSRWECLAPQHPQGSRQRGREGGGEGQSKGREVGWRHGEQQQSWSCSCGGWQRSRWRFTETILRIIVYTVCCKEQMSQRPLCQ